MRSISGLNFVTNGKYLFYSNGHGKNYLGYKQNRIYRYNIKKKTNKYILKVNKNWCAIPIAKKGKYLIYEKGQEATTIYYSYNLKTHKKRKIGNFGYSSIKVKGKRVYITTTTLDVGDPQYRFVYTLSGKKIAKITLKKGWY